MPTRAAAQSAVTPSCGQADHRCGLVLSPMVTETTWFAASGRNRMMSQRQSLGSACSRTGMMNSAAITIEIVPAVCRTIAPSPNAMSATSVTNSAQPTIATSTVDGWITSMPEKTTLEWTHPGGNGPLPLVPPPPAPCCRQTTFAFCGILTEWNSEALTPLDDSSAWPTKNAMNDVMSETTSVTD